jgi:hypothetical protein
MESKTLGIIAGRGKLPAVAARNAAAMGYRVVVSLIRETGAKWPKSVGDRVETISIGEAGRTRALFAEEGVRDVLMIGKVDKSLNFAEIRFDEAALALLSRLAVRQDMNFARVIIDDLTDRGFRVVEQTHFLEDLLAPEGVIAGALDDALQLDIERGMEVARDLARHDIGQTVAIRQGAIIAVEALRRRVRRRQGGEAGSGHALRCSGRRPEHNPRAGQGRRAGAGRRSRAHADRRPKTGGGTRGKV